VVQPWAIVRHVGALAGLRRRHSSAQDHHSFGFGRHGHLPYACAARKQEMDPEKGSRNPESRVLGRADFTGTAVPAAFF
jgi:hypothetical protein